MQNIHQAKMVLSRSGAEQKRGRSDDEVNGYEEGKLHVHPSFQPPHLAKLVTRGLSIQNEIETKEQ
jgi:hypothetical protein